jgi:hypothetical protein
MGIFDRWHPVQGVGSELQTVPGGGTRWGLTAITIDPLHAFPLMLFLWADAYVSRMRPSAMTAIGRPHFVQSIGFLPR